MFQSSELLPISDALNIASHFFPALYLPCAFNDLILLIFGHRCKLIQNV